ncbi:MAG TPA: M56 family metallopeptidase [Longimicrobium sp.]
MIAHWMLYCALVGVLLSGCAAALEKALRSLGRPTRWVWAAALLLTLLVPAAAWMLAPDHASFPAAPTAAPGSAAAAAPQAAPGAGVAPAAPRAEVARATPPLTVPAWWEVIEPRGRIAVLFLVWLLSSAAAALALVTTARVVERRRGEWMPARVDGVPVLVSHDVGPAVVGVLRPRIVLPRWALGAGTHARALMLVHEQEHVRAGDPRLLAAALAAVVLMPWNPAGWWQLRRLRLAVEVDCDARVLRRADIAGYGSVLLDVGRRVSRTRLVGAVAIVESISTLERRIRIMTAPRVRRPLLRAAAFCAVAMALTAAAWQAPAPVQPPVTRLEVRPGTAALTRSAITPRVLLERYYPRVLRQGMHDDEMAVFVLSHGGEVVHHNLVRTGSLLGYASSGAAVQREIRPYMGQTGSVQSYAGLWPELGPTVARVSIHWLRPTAAEVVNVGDLSGRMERRSYLRAVRRHYPRALRRAGVTGQVAVRIRVEPYQKPEVLEVVRGDPRFFDAARAVVGDLHVSGRGENFMVISFPAEHAVAGGRSY